MLVQSNVFSHFYAVAALAIDKVGPRPYHFRSGPTSGPTTRPGSQKSKISVVHNLVVLKGHTECLKCGKALWRPGLRPGPRWRSLQRFPDPLAGGEGPGCPLPKNPTLALGPLGLQPWPFGPRSLPPQIRLPKFAFVVN